MCFRLILEKSARDSFHVRQVKSGIREDLDSKKSVIVLQVGNGLV